MGSSPNLRCTVSVRVWKRQTKLLTCKPLVRAKIGGADAYIILFLKTCLYCLEVLYLSCIHALFLFSNLK